MKKIFILIMTIALIAGLTGCGTTSKKANTTSTQKLDKENKVSQTPTAYNYVDTTNNKIVFLTKDSYDVVEATKTIKGYAIANYGDFKTIKGDETQAFMSASLLQRNVNQNGQKLVKDGYAKDQLVDELNQLDIAVITFNKAMTTAQAQYVVKFTTRNATSDYLQRRGIELNKPYKKNVNVDLIKENGVWKIDSSNPGEIQPAQ